MEGVIRRKIETVAKSGESSKFTEAHGSYRVETMEFDNHARHWTYGGHDEHRGCTRSKGEEHTDFPAFGFADAVKSTGRQGDYLELALGLFTDEDRCELSERQLVVLGKLCKARQGG